MVVLSGAGCGGGDDGSEQVVLDGPPVTRADLGSQSDLDAGRSVIDGEKEAVIEAYEAAQQARIESAAAPEPDPDLPALAATHTEPSLSEWQDKLVGLVAQGHAIRYPDDSQAEIVAVEVDFSWWVDDETAPAAGEAAADDIGDRATLRVCILDDGEVYEVGSGDVHWSGLYTFDEVAVMRKVDGEWLVAEFDAVRREGRVGCAAE